jgi:signal transduction histidine kinase
LTQPLRKRIVFTVQARLIFLLAVLSLILLVYLAWSNRNQQLQLDAFLQDRDKQFSSHFNQVFSLFQKPLDVVVYEYSLWDEMADFVQKRDRKWAGENIDFALRQYGLVAAWVFDPGRSPVYIANTSEASASDLQFSEEMKQRLFASAYVCHFFLPTSHGLFEVFGGKIQPSGDNKRASPAKGYLFMARFWGQKVVNELGRLTESTVTLNREPYEPVPTNSDAKRENRIFKFTMPLIGWEGKPIGSLSVRHETPVIPKMKIYSNRDFWLSAALGCFGLALVSFCLLVWIRKPLAAISKSLNEEDPDAISHLCKSPTEFGQISRLIADFFLDRKSLVDEVERRKQAESNLRAAGEELEQKVAERTEDLSKSSLLLRSLASQLLLAEERERRRIADDLHDHIGQILVLAKLRVEQLQEISEDSRSHSLLEEIEKLLADTLNYSRSLTVQLSPPVLREFGFEAAVKSLANEFERKYGIPVTVEDDLTTRVGDRQIAVLLYRSVRELLHNVIKHSKATAVKILFATRNDHMVTEVEDNGFGFIPDQIDDINQGNRFGLFSIRERLTYLGGEMRIESAPGRGTKVLLFVPAILAINATKRREDGEYSNSSGGRS